MENAEDFPEFVDKMANYSGYYKSDELYYVERTFDERAWHAYMVTHWTSSFYFSAIYVTLVFLGKHYMTDRPRFDLRLPLTLWSACLAVFSIVGVARSMPEFLYILATRGYEESVCNPAYTFLTTSSFPFWSCLFLVSKLFELGDTAFIVLRKQPLIFLHWYHHVTVMCYSWYTFIGWTAPTRWFMVMNYGVHSLMYSYYALRAMRVRLPRVVSILITALQILQMVMGIVINVSTYWYKSSGHPCQQPYISMYAAIAMYGSYFVLFAHFFFNAYLKPKPTKSEKREQNGHATEHSNGVSADKLKSQ